MVNNEREYERRERKRKKDKKTRRIIWIIISAVIVALVVMRLCEVNFSSLKDRFTDNDGKLSLSAQVGEKNFPYNIDSSQNVKVNNVGSKLAILTDDSYTVIDPGDASVIYGAVHGYSNPMMRTSDSYSVIFDQGGNKLRLDSASENVFETQLNNSILCADVSDDGYITYATTSKSNRSEVYLCNKFLNKRISYKESYGYVTSVAIDSSGKTIAFASTNSENAHIKTKIYIMKSGSKKPSKTFEIDDSVIDIKFDGNSVYVVGQDFISVIKKGKDLKKVVKEGKMNTVSYDFNSSGNLVLAYNEYSNSTDNKLIKVDNNGKIRSTIKLNGAVKDISASSKDVSVLFNDRIDTYNISKEKKVSTTKCSDSARSITRMSSKLFIRHQTRIEREDVIS